MPSSCGRHRFCMANGGFVERVVVMYRVPSPVVAPGGGLNIVITGHYVFLILLNFLASLAYWIDVRRARLGQRRVGDVYLLWIAGLGGSAGIKCTQVWYSHIEQPKRFRSSLNLIIAAQLCAFLLLFEPIHGALTLLGETVAPRHVTQLLTTPR